jgi:hypothetical protein
MSEMNRRVCSCAWSAAVVLAGLCVVLLPVLAQNSPGQGAKPPVKYDAKKFAGNFDKVVALPPGGPAPRTADGHPDMTGRYYPNHAGRMLQVGYQIDPSIMEQFDRKATPQESPVFKPDAGKYMEPPFPYGSCPLGATPISIVMQQSEHGPLELILLPGRIWMLNEFPQTVRFMFTDGRPHSKDPDPTFGGESIGHWEGDTLVVDTIGVDSRVMDMEKWHPSEKQHLIERFTRTSKNYLTYELTIEDPLVLAKPYHYVPHTWSLAQNPNDVWTEYLCTGNEEPSYMQTMAPKQRQQIEEPREPGQPAPVRQ